MSRMLRPAAASVSRVYDARVTTSSGGPRHENRRQRFPRPRPGAAPLRADVLARIDAASPHRPIMVREVLRTLQPRPGDVVVDATLGGGGHAEALLAHIQPRGRLLGLDIDPIELPATEARLRAAGQGPETFIARRGSFADLPRFLSDAAIAAADLVLVDLGVSSMQHDTPARGFTSRPWARSTCAWTRRAARPRRRWSRALDEAALTRPARVDMRTSRGRPSLPGC